MMLAFGIGDIIRVPFGYLLDILYQFFNNYGVALIAFSVIIKLILLPASAKSKKSSMKMSRLQPQIQYIQKKFEGDQQKQSAAIQELYKSEGVSMGGGCLWSMLPLLILIPLYTVIREPIAYILHEGAEVLLADGTKTTVAVQLVEKMKELRPELFENVNAAYHQLVAAANLSPEAATAVEGVKDVVRAGTPLRFGFLGIDLGLVPEYKVWADTWQWNWAHIGAFLMPVLSALFQLGSMIISQKVNKSLITNEKGVQDKEAAKKSQSNQTTQIMLYMMPLMTIFIGFGVPAALSLYWLIQSITSTVADLILTKHYRKKYDAEDASKLAKALEEEAKEAEKERLRAERRAANPDGITENTSKKKLQQKQQKEQEAARAAAKREYNAKRGIVEEEPEAPKPLSGVAERPFCKGRAYDPDRYAQVTTEE